MALTLETTYTLIEKINSLQSIDLLSLDRNKLLDVMNLMNTAFSGGGGGGSSPLTTKGDIWGYTTVDARVSVGANNTVLTADSTTASGLAYKTIATIVGGTLSGNNTGDQTISLTGDVTGSGTGSFTTTLANTAVSAGSYTSANITVDAKGRITAAANGSGGGSDPLTTVITGYSSGSGVVSASDTILQAFNKLDGNQKNNYVAVTDVTTTSQTIALDGANLQTPAFKHSANNNFTYTLANFKDNAVIAIAITKTTGSNITVTLSAATYTHFVFVGGIALSGNTLPVMTQSNGAVGFFTGIVIGTSIYWSDSSGNTSIVSPTFSGTVTFPTQTNSVGAFLLPAGTLLTTAVSGYIENDGTNLFYTTSIPNRRTVVNIEATQTLSGAKTFTNTVTMPSAITADATGLGVGSIATSTNFVNITKTYTSNSTGSYIALQARATYSPSNTVGTGYIGYGAIIQSSVSTAQAVYAVVGTYSSANNGNTATTTNSIAVQGVSFTSAASGTGTITNSIGMYAYTLQAGAGIGVMTNSYSFYGGISKKSGAGNFTGTNSYIFYSESTIAANSPDLRTGVSYNIGTFTNNFSFYSAGGNNAFLGNLAIGLAANTAATTLLELGAGTTTIAPLGFTSGSLLTTPLVGKEEFLTDSRYITITTGTARKEYMLADTTLVSTRISFATTNGRQTDSANLVYVSGTGLSITDNLKLTTAGNGIYIKEGSTNATMGPGTLVAGTATISTTKVTANSRIFVVRSLAGGTLGDLGEDSSARVNGTSFVVNSMTLGAIGTVSVLDTSSFVWIIIEPS